MYKNREGYRRMVVQDVSCYVPPVGYVHDLISNTMVETGVYSRSSTQSEQYWERPPVPKNYEEKREDEMERQELNPLYFDEELEYHRRTEWFRRLNGFWFMNNGKAVYLTGMHYMYLAHWKIDIGYPDFRWADLEYFYFLQVCIEDPNCGGMLCFANRRQGKSYRSALFLYDVITKNKNSLGGIQSKSKEDASDYFLLHVVEPFKTLPDYFRPVYDTSQGDSPKRELRFFPTSKRGKVDRKDKLKALNSRINFRAAGEKEYDGRKLKAYVCDEFGKVVDISVIERHRVIRPCLMDGRNIVGKALYITTVEDMNNGRSIDECRKLWEDSDPRDKDANGRTRSLLYRFFIPAYKAYIFDKYGMPRTVQAKKSLNNVFQQYIDKGDFVGLASEKRKYPFDIDDVFRVAAKAPIFNIIALNDRLAQLAWRKEEELYTKGNLVWQNGERDTKVSFVPNPSGRFLVRYPMDGATQEWRRPINKTKFVIGCDPYDHKVAMRPSNGASYGFKKYDPYDNDYSNSLIFEYCARPTPNVFYEDQIKACVYWGCRILCENNRIGLVNYFLDRGYGDFLVWFPGLANPGIFAGEKSKQLAAEHIEDYISNHIGKIYFPKLLEDLIQFDLQDSTKFDRAMAFGWTLVAAGNLTLKQEEDEKVEITQFFKTHKL
jgi:hypothetical protein